ncbi:hypothetical protein K438DRAFT_1998423 [Mycena galopus ATCC 62051]|nr:hypothetical protein K438DRAFT_1998423 [Mycena galopus ATCC 62051]
MREAFGKEPPVVELGMLVTRPDYEALVDFGLCEHLIDGTAYNGLPANLEILTENISVVGSGKGKEVPFDGLHPDVPPSLSAAGQGALRIMPGVGSLPTGWTAATPASHAGGLLPVHPVPIHEGATLHQVDSAHHTGLFFNAAQASSNATPLSVPLAAWLAYSFDLIRFPTPMTPSSLRTTIILVYGSMGRN